MIDMFPIWILVINLIVVLSFYLPVGFVYSYIKEPGVMGDKQRRKYKFSTKSRYFILSINSFILFGAISIGKIII